MYDDKDNLIAEKAGGTEVYRNYYSSNGRLYQKRDHKNKSNIYYDYDDKDRIIREYEDYDTGNDTSVVYTYNNYDQVATSKKKYGSTSWSVSNQYTDKHELDTSTNSYGITVDYEYDSLGRVSSKNFGDTIQMGFGYTSGNADGSTTGLVSSYVCRTKEGVEDIVTYYYDETGLLEKQRGLHETIYYEYDTKSQLKSVYNETEEQRRVYEYDNAGNILEKTELYDDGQGQYLISTVEYEYDSNWDDLLIKYDGETIEYDAIGNPTKYLEYNKLIWNGRQLAIIYEDDLFVSGYIYNSDGIRTTKNTLTGSVEYEYIGGELSIQKDTQGNILYFTYDANGDLLSVRYNGADYYYIKNPQGDVIALCDEDENVVERYTYDEWGKPTSTPTTPIGNLNPFRYRGYIYDSETGFYLTGTRYYDPEIGRFINADDTAYLGCNCDLNSYNLFAYCGNNPVNRKDINGNFWVNALIGAAVNVTTTFIAAKVTGQEYTIKDAAVAALSGAVNSLGIWGKIASGVISGVYSGIMSYQSGANIGEAIVCSTASGISASLSIGNIAYFSDVVVDTATTVAVDLVFGTAYNTLAAATYKGVTNNAQVRNRNKNNSNSVLANKPAVPTPQKAPWKTKTYVYSYGVRI